MKSIRVIACVFAFAFAIAGAFVSQANDANGALVTKYGWDTASNPDVCCAGTLNETDCSTVYVGVPCSVTCSSGTFTAYNTRSSATVCANILRQPAK